MPNVSANDAAIYAANDLLKALTHPQPPNSFITMGDDQIAALRQLATIFQRSITKKPTSEPGVPDIAPPQRPRMRSQRKQLANAAFTAPQRDKLCHDPPQPPDETKQQVDLDPEPPDDTKIYTKHHIIPVIPNLRPQYPTKHEGMLEDPFPPTQSANAVMDPDTGKPLEYKQLINHPSCHLCQTWQQSSCNEFGRLAQGVGGRIAGTDTIRSIHHNDMPMNQRPTYARFVCEIRPQKAEKERTRLTVGGNLIDYPDPVTTRTCNLVTFKMHINSSLSRVKRKYCSFDVKNFYLNTPMECFEYMKIPLAHIPDEITSEYVLKNKVHSNGTVYIEIRKGIYGLPQAGMLANQLLKRRLAKHG